MACLKALSAFMSPRLYYSMEPSLIPFPTSTQYHRRITKSLRNVWEASPRNCVHSTFRLVRTPVTFATLVSSRSILAANKRQGSSSASIMCLQEEKRKSASSYMNTLRIIGARRKPKMCLDICIFKSTMEEPRGSKTQTDSTRTIISNPDETKTRVPEAPPASLLSLHHYF